MDEEWTWYWGEGSEPEAYSPANSREDAVAKATRAAHERDLTEMTVCEGKPWKLRDDFFNADMVLEQWNDWNEDCQDEQGELSMEPTPDQEADLVLALNAAFAAWRAKHKLGRAYPLDTRNSEVISIPLVAHS